MTDQHWKQRTSAGVLLVCSLATVLAFATGCGGSGRSATTGSTSTAATTAHPDRFAEQRTMFRDRCASCHTLLDARVPSTKKSDEEELDGTRSNLSTVRNYLMHHYPPMPDFSKTLSPGEIKALSIYVATVDGCGTPTPTSCNE